MKHPSPHRLQKIVPVTLAAALTFATGCQWLSPRTSPYGDALTDAQRDSVEIYFRDYNRFRRENSKLQARVTSLELDLAKTNAAYQQQAQLAQYLRQENEGLASDLDQVEKQFVSLEQRLRSKETKASAVAAIAEVQLLFEKLQQEEPGALDSLTAAEVTAKLKSSDELMKKDNYAAAVYFSNRAMRILNQTERRKNVPLTEGTTGIIAVEMANLRDGPGSRYKVLEKLEFGTVVVQLESRSEWSRIRTASGTSGWVHSSLIR